MRVVVVGAGVAGTAAALALDKAGFEASVYEAHPDSGGDIGAFLTLGSNGMRALGQLDAAGPVAGAGFRLISLWVVLGSGEAVATRPLAGREDSLSQYMSMYRDEMFDSIHVYVVLRWLSFLYC